MTHLKMAESSPTSDNASAGNTIINVNGNDNTVMVFKNNNDSNVTIQYRDGHVASQSEKTEPVTDVGLLVSCDERATTSRKKGSASKYVRDCPPNIRSSIVHTLSKITGPLKSERYKEIVVKLSYLTQRGLWTKLHRYCEQLYSNLRTCENTDLQIVVLSYQTIAECLQMKMYNAAEHIALMTDLLPRALNREFLKARLYYVRGYKSRKDCDYVNAAKYFECALKIFQTFEPCVFHGAALFHQACVKYACLPSTWTGNLLQDVIDDIDKASRMFQSSDLELSFNIQQRAIVKQAMVLIDCDNSVGRQRELLGDVVRKVKRSRFLLKSLNMYKDPVNPSKYTNCNYLLGQANCHYRLGEHLFKTSPGESLTHYVKAKFFALDALCVAEKHTFNSEIRSINFFLEDVLPKIRCFNEAKI